MCEGEMDMALFGVETEYGLAAPGAEASRERNVAVACELVEAVRRRVPSLAAAGKSGAFLGNGSLIYVDRDHLEVASPEVNDPTTVVRYMAAGHRTLERAVACCYPDPAHRPTLFVSSVCLAGRVSFGCHENYLYRADARISDPRDLLIPHLATRVVFAGSGGLDPSPGVSFVVSPRALFLLEARSTSTMGRRGIVDEVEEPLRIDDYRRIHLIAGDALLGAIGNYLKVGTTLLVLAMIQAGVAPWDSVALADPVAALHAITRDPSCRIHVDLARGGQATAVTIQRVFLEAAEDHVGASFMPPWAASVCGEWRRTLDILERDPESAGTTLDWSIKCALFCRVLARHQMDWAAMAAWTDALGALWAELRPRDGWEALPDPSVLLEPHAERSALKAGAASIFNSRGLCFQDLPRFLACRRAMFECDIRYGELSERGLFRQLDREGVLHHHLPGLGDEDIERAVEQPPENGRARLRGEAIQRLTSSSARYVCDWESITDRSSGSWFDLIDPLEPAARWRAANEEPNAGPPAGVLKVAPTPAPAPVASQ